MRPSGTLLALLAAASLPLTAAAQTVSEDFTGTTTTNGWYFFNGACLTASRASGNEPSGASTGQIPGCVTLYAGGNGPLLYDEPLVGGYNGVAGWTTAQLPDPASHGALRFTNGNLAGNANAGPGGQNQNGAVISATPFPSSQGVAVTFRTVTYRGDGGGGGHDGAYGMSFFLMDASQLNGSGVGSLGGSLGYSCSNANPPFNGLIGGYLGLGIDEYGNFLNSPTNTTGELNASGGLNSPATPTGTTGDNTATGGGYMPNRIGVRGAGNVAWAALTGAYNGNPNNAAAPYYPTTLAQSCLNGGGTYDANNGMCDICPAGTTYNAGQHQCEQCSGAIYLAGTNTCESCPSGQVYDAASNSCLGCTNGAYDAATNTCSSCPAGSTYDPNSGQCQTCSGAYSNYDSGNGMCQICPSSAPSWTGPSSNECCPNGYTWGARSQSCRSSGGGRVSGVDPTSATPTTSAPVTGPASSFPPNSPNSSSPNAGNPDSYYAVQNTCQSGSLWNYAVPNAPTSAGAAALSNAANSAPILDYAAIPNAYTVLPAGAQIANETAESRGAATPISYNLSISPDGLLSVAYSINGGAYQQIVKSQSITAANGPLPANFLFGFAGSSGGSTNIHEILCFKAQSQTTAASSASASQRQAAKLQTGAQAFFAFYNPTDWTGSVTANSLGLDQFGNVVVSPTASWDASCVLSGVGANGTCASTGAAGPIAAQVPASRVILSWNGSRGTPFEYGSLTGSQQVTLDAGDNSSASCNASAAYDPSDRAAYLRGDRSCEINTQGVGLFRARDGVLADVVDSSPAWVGPPIAPYLATWNDRLYPLASNAENAAGAPSYVNFTQSNETRLNVVYAGSNDGLLHGFRSGSYAANGTFCSAAMAGNCTGTVTPNDGQEVLAYMPGAVLQTIHSASNTGVDYSGRQYGHAFFVDATPGTGDLFYGGAWHSWVVGGLGPGGAAIYALDVTDPTRFSEANAASLVIGEWTPATISCAGTTSGNGGANCGSNLGNTYGTPAIRRLHNGDWAVIFGNGFGSASGDAGIYVMTIDPNTAGTTFYYLSTSTGSAGSPNGIAYASPVDLDGDHITDFVYAGDLQGNLWRFDLTSSNPGNWAVTPGPLFTTPSGQPITTAVVAASGAPYPGMQQFLMLLFGTGQKSPLSNVNAATYAGGTQSLYGVWDWNLTGWNSIGKVAYAALAATDATGLSGTNQTIQQANLQQQIVSINSSTGNRDITSNATVCWQGSQICSGTNSAYGWFLNLPGTQEQIIYNPELVQQALTVNSIVPAATDPTSCALPTDTGFTYALSAMTGAAFNQVFLPPAEAAAGFNTNPLYMDAYAIAMQTNATGSSFVTVNSSGTPYLVYETSLLQGASGNGTFPGGTLGLNLPRNTGGRRISWVERR
jgi:type IV pilus assembly protein PilY1